jgi:hypothetical protein
MKIEVAGSSSSSISIGAAFEGEARPIDGGVRRSPPALNEESDGAARWSPLPESPGLETERA